jgi:hypothetical protein
MTAHPTSLFPSRTPHFNHVAMSLPADRLEAEGRQDICDFYGEVFGWQELPTMTVDRRRLVLSAHTPYQPPRRHPDWRWLRHHCPTFQQFVFLMAEDQPMACPRMDHFGLSVGDLDELRAAHARACAYRERDDRVEIVDPSVDDHEVVKIHSFYVRYLLPLMVEIQYWEF